MIGASVGDTHTAIKLGKGFSNIFGVAYIDGEVGRHVAARGAGEKCTQLNVIEYDSVRSRQSLANHSRFATVARSTIVLCV